MNTSDINWIEFFAGVQRFMTKNTPYSTIKAMLEIPVGLFGKEYTLMQMKKCGFSQLGWIIGGNI
ncbi:MAG: hypothetical protein PUI63_00835 [Alistipes senegalensis]|uniref:hypothetical protein n=1 Tax=Alistipes senegalensis TaxID=1288121 RepID=UPI00242C3E19|nr:hypothetical protein [Alistipes senegalensis]MDD7037757.1 hypothetical protein [Alistipes senegalensis]